MEKSTDVIPQVPKEASQHQRLVSKGHDTVEVFLRPRYTRCFVGILNAIAQKACPIARVCDHKNKKIRAIKQKFEGHCHLLHQRVLTRLACDKERRPEGGQLTNPQSC